MEEPRPPPPVRVLVGGPRDVLGLGLEPQVLQVEHDHPGRAGRDVGQAGLEDVAVPAPIAEETAPAQRRDDGPAPRLVEHPPEGGERREVVGVEARHRTSGDRGEGVRGVRVRGDLDLEDVASVQAVPGHGSAHVRRDHAEILAHDHGVGTSRLEREDRVHLVRPVSDVHAVVAVHPVGHHEQPMQSHDVVDSDHPGQAQEVAQARDRVPITVPPDPLRRQRGEAPVLAPGEERIGRGAGRDPIEERAPLAPHVVTGGVHAEREVEVQAGAAPSRLSRRPLELLRGHPLRVEVIASGAFARLRIHRRQPISFGRRPCTPRPAVALASCPEPRVVLHRGVAPDERLEGLPAPPRGREEERGQHLQHASFGRHRPPVVDERLVEERFELGTNRAGGQHRSGFLTALHLRDRGQVHVQLVPEQPAGRRVGTRIERLVQEGRQQRQRGHSLPA